MKNRKRSGFTLAEVLAVVAILLILFGVIAVNVAARQRSMTRLEFDAIAKEIFIAAQNHLIEAESQGYLGLDEADFGEKVTEEKTDESGKTYQQVTFYDDSTNPHKIQKQMLPDYAVDYAGDFVIHYQAHPARVLDVYYSDPQKSSLLTIAGKSITVGDTNVLEQHRGFESDQVAKREKYPNGAGKWVIGWYGGDGAQTQGVQLEVPTFEIHNEEQLYVKVFDPNVGKKSIDGVNNLSYNLKLVVKGKSSGAEKYFTLKSTGGTDIDLGRCVKTDGEKEYSILLDDVSDGLHFAQLTPSKASTTTVDGSFTPGEDLEIFVVAYSSTELTNIAKSGSQDTNSLFADPAPASAGTPASTEVKYSDVDSGLAAIANFRHLENLDKKVSGLKKSISKAAQTSDMDWTAEWKDWKGEEAYWTSRKIQPLDEDSDPTETGCFYPVSPDYALTYNGNPPKQAAGSDDPAAAPDYRGHVIKNVKVDYSGPAGLFGSMLSGSAVNDLELIDFNVKSSDNTGKGNAGALIGTADGVAVTNVLARNSKEKDGKTTPTVTSSFAAAGGLVGSMSGASSVTNSAAALVVSGGTEAGGLIGSMSGGTVTGSYAGGHTTNGKYQDTAGAPLYNVTGATAGGLIGASSATITNCYATCSAKGTTAAGGLIGNSGGSVSSCYATGLVDAPNGSGGALIGTGSASGGDNKYLWIINQDQAWQKAIMNDYTDPAVAGPMIAGPQASPYAAGDIKDVTVSTDAYRGFLIGSSQAVPYDVPLLKVTYGGKYPMLSIKDLGGAPDVSNYDDLYYVSAHYGDWPMPETLVINN